MAQVQVTGLKSEEHMFKNSLEEAALATLEKIEKEAELSPEDMLHLHVKSHVEGKKKRFEVSARLRVRGKVYSAGEPDSDYHRSAWDLHLSAKEALEELRRRIVEDLKVRRVKGLSEDEVLEKRAKMNG